MRVQSCSWQHFERPSFHTCIRCSSKSALASGYSCPPLGTGTKNPNVASWRPWMSSAHTPPRRPSRPPRGLLGFPAPAPTMALPSRW
ncbi:hypothetical protein U9M48_015392 [Paspalum notatum var. saurae]|uniref:Uncharacterized protein n=1 Tax=Paspalum notatum var. saurae TaxID=547442 RepID=A0AAQ3T4B9_PASNO